MRYSVSRLLKGPVGAQENHAVQEPIDQVPADLRAVSPLTGRVKMLRTDRGVLVIARLALTVRSVCSRCGEEISILLSIDFNEEFPPTVDILTGLPVSHPSDEQAFLIDEHHELDIGEAVQEYGLLALPMQPLCRSDCAGLCNQCGLNLNYGRCNCTATSEDPRWAALRSLLQEKPTEKT